MIKKTLFFGSKAQLTTKYNQMLVKTDERETTIPIEDIGFIVLEHQETYISLPLLSKLNDNNVAVIFCDSFHMPTAMLLNLDGHYLQQELFTAQLSASEPLKKQLWQQLIKAKILNQAALLQRLGKNINPLQYYASKVLSGDTDNREGAAAAYYWKHLFDFDFNRDRNGCFPNVWLNYGYTILRAAVARAITGSGLLPTVGIYHHNRYNAYCLADDLMEPFRPLIDAKVLELLKTNPDETLSKEIKAALLQVLTQTVYFEDHVSPLLVGLHTTCSSLQQCFTGKTRKLILPELWN